MTQSASPQATNGKPGPMLAADGTPLKRSLARALRRQKMRALLLIAPLLLFVLITFIAPIADITRGFLQVGATPVLSLELFNRDYWAMDALEVAKIGLNKMKASVAPAL